MEEADAWVSRKAERSEKIGSRSTPFVGERDGMRGQWIGHVSPKAARGGPIALLEDGDMIRIDIPNRGLSMVGMKETPMSPGEADTLLNQRKKKWRPPAHKHTAGILKRFSLHAASAMKGAYLED